MDTNWSTISNTKTVYMFAKKFQNFVYCHLVTNFIKPSAKINS